MNNTYWDFEYEVERCTYCDEIMLDEHCHCQEDSSDDNSYNSRLKRGFEMLDMEGEL